MTEEEGWRPVGVQCQVHCTPLIQASARAASDRLDGWKGECVGVVCTRRGGTLVASGARGKWRSFWFFFVSRVCIRAFPSFCCIFYVRGRPIRNSPCEFPETIVQWAGTTFQLSAGLTALPHSSIYLERATSGKWIHHHHHHQIARLRDSEIERKIVTWDSTKNQISLNKSCQQFMRLYIT